MQDSILTTVVKDIDGEVTTLEKYAGNVLLIVNVASKWGLTPQYEQLENIQKAWSAKAVHRCTRMIFYGILKNSWLAGTEKSSSVFPRI